MRIFAGKKKAQKILLKLQKKIAQKKINPVLAVISVGRNPASELFIKNKKQAAENIGVEVRHFRFKEGVLAKKIIDKINCLNEDKKIHGIIVQLPLPGKLNAGKIVGAINPLKDVDGFGLKTKFYSPLASAILSALKDSVKNLSDKKIIALVNSDFLGQSLKKFLKREKIKIAYLLRNKNWQVKMRKADVIITVCGLPGLIKGECVKKKAALIDAGIVVLKNRKVAGDVDRASVEETISFLTPVPGGLGPLTVAYLLENVYLSAEKIYGFGN
jgi:methylenetetrahydrofolate dehydrogenase (NADP+)/methenyltetrahydrofolate cyclohydrolase